MLTLMPELFHTNNCIRHQYRWLVARITMPVWLTQNKPVKVGATILTCDDDETKADPHTKTEWNRPRARRVTEWCGYQADTIHNVIYVCWPATYGMLTDRDKDSQPHGRMYGAQWYRIWPGPWSNDTGFESIFIMPVRQPEISNHSSWSWPVLKIQPADQGLWIRAMPFWRQNAFIQWF